MVKISCKFGKFCSSSLFLPLLLILSTCFVIVFKILANLFIFRLDMLKVLLSSIEVMLIFSTVVSPIAEKKNSHKWAYALQFLNYLCLFFVKFALSLSENIFFFVVERKSTCMTPENSLYCSTGSNFLLEIPLDSQHPPISLDCYCCKAFLISMLLSISTINSIKTRIYQIMWSFDNESITDKRLQNFYIRQSKPDLSLRVYEYTPVSSALIALTSGVHSMSWWPPCVFVLFCARIQPYLKFRNFNSSCQLFVL